MFRHIERLVYVLYYFRNQTIACYPTSFTQEGQVSVLNYFGNQNFSMVFAYHLLLFTVSVHYYFGNKAILGIILFICFLMLFTQEVRLFVSFCFVSFCFVLFCLVFLVGFCFVLWGFGGYFWKYTFNMLSYVVHTGRVSFCSLLMVIGLFAYYLKLFMYT